MNTTLSHMLRSWFFISLTLLGACSNRAGNISSNDTSQPLMTLTGALAAVSEQLSGTYAVYSEAGTLLLNGDLLLTDDGTGGVVVSAPAMTLERNTIYRFVIVYFWDGVAIAYVDSTQTTENDEATTITFTADSIEYAVLTGLSASESATFAASVSAGTLPDLDLDDDGFSNFIELRSGTDPNDASSVPTGPTMTDFAAAISADGNTLTITATITDGHGVSDVALSFPDAAYLTNVLTTTISGADGDTSRTLSATFNPQYAPLGELDIQLSASDALELTATSTITTTIVHNGTNVGPVIDFESPSATGAILSGTTTLSVRAYDATDGVTSLTLTQPASLTDLSTSTDLFTAAWNTATIVDNTTTTLTASAVDGLGATTTKSLTVTISNGTDLSGPTITLTVDEQAYASLGTVSGTIDIRATATDATGVASLSLDNEDDIAGLTVVDEFTTSADYTIDTTQYTNGETITLNFAAFDTHGYESMTSFTLTANNDLDGDGYSATSLGGTDCNDSNAAISPSAQEQLDGLDNDCEGSVDYYSLSLADIKYIGEDAEDRTGYSVSSAGDVNGDGFDDSLISSRYADDGGLDAGAVYLIYGGANATGNMDLSLADAKFIAENAGDYAGYSVSGAGDVNGDGFDDILIGAYYNENTTSEPDAGAAYLIYGGNETHLLSGDTDLSTADAKFIGEAAENLAGYSVSSAGDVNGDGYDDILIGAPLNDSGADNAGATYLLYGESNLTGQIDLSAADAKFMGEHTDDWAGISVSSAGDVNSDGFDDILIGSSYEDSGGSSAGAAYLIYGEINLTRVVNLSSADAKFTGEAAADYAGYVVSSAGDVNGDGKDDILIGAPFESTRGTYAGAAYLVYGRSDGYSGLTPLLLSKVGSTIPGAKFTGENAGDYAGYSVSSAGDINNDGYNDLLVGAPLENSDGSNAGATYLLYGEINLTGVVNFSSADVKFTGEAAEDYAGYVVSNAGDVNGDGKADILIGSIYESTGGSGAGAAYLILNQY